MTFIPDWPRALRETRENFVRVLTENPDESYRLGAIDMLAGLKPQGDIAVREALQAAAAHNPSEDVRREAAELLKHV